MENFVLYFKMSFFQIWVIFLGRMEMENSILNGKG